MFGHDFPQSCIKPDGEGFGDMTIDSKIIQHCKDEARRYREEEPQNNPLILTPDLGSVTPSPTLQRVGCARAKVTHVPRSPYDSPELGAYDSDVSSIDHFTLPPSTPPIFRNPWTTVNDLRTPPRSVPTQVRHLPSPRTIMNGYKPRPTMVIDIPLTPPRTIASRATSIELSPTSIPGQQLSALRTTCNDDQQSATKGEDDRDRLSCAISLLCTATGLSRAEIGRRLDIPEEVYTFDESLDAAITMVSLKTGLAWKEVTSRLDSADSRHKRSTSW